MGGASAREIDGSIARDISRVEERMGGRKGGRKRGREGGRERSETHVVERQTLVMSLASSMLKAVLYSLKVSPRARLSTSSWTVPACLRKRLSSSLGPLPSGNTYTRFSSSFSPCEKATKPRSSASSFAMMRWTESEGGNS